MKGVAHRGWAVRWPTLASLTALILLAAFLRFVNLGHTSLWLDEIYDLIVLPGATLGRLAFPVDQHPPLYYLLLHYWLVLGHGELWMRLPSALAGVLSVPLMWQAGAALGSRRAGLLAAALLALSPLQVWYAREARMYGPANLAWAAALYSFVALMRWGRWRHGLGLAGSTLAGLLLTYSTFGIWLLEAAGVALLWPLLSRLSFRRWLLSQIFVGVGFAAWWPGLSRQLQNPLVFHWALLPEPFGVAWGVSLTLAQLMQLGATLTLVTLAVLFCASLALRTRPALAAWWQRLARPAAWTIVAVMTTGLLLGAVPIGLSARRQFLAFWPPLILLAAEALVWMRRRWLAGGLLGLGLVLSLVMVFGGPYEDWRSVAGFVAGRAQPRDQILVDVGWATPAFAYYYHGQAPYSGLDPANLPQSLTPPPAPGAHLWLVLVDTNQADPAGRAIAWVDGQARPIGTHSFGRISVVEYLAR